MPYGYVVIDHNSREVYKGSDLVALKILIANATNNEQSTPGAGNCNDYTKFKEVNNNEEISTANNNIYEVELGKILGDFFNEIERANYQGDGRGKKRRNRRGRGI